MTQTVLSIRVPWNDRVLPITTEVCCHEHTFACAYSVTFSVLEASCVCFQTIFVLTIRTISSTTTCSSAGVLYQPRPQRSWRVFQIAGQQVKYCGELARPSTKQHTGMIVSLVHLTTASCSGCCATHQEVPRCHGSVASNLGTDFKVGNFVLSCQRLSHLSGNLNTSKVECISITAILTRRNR